MVALERKRSWDCFGFFERDGEEETHYEIA